MKQFSPFPGLNIAYSHRKDGSFRDHDSVNEFLYPTVNLPISFLKLQHTNEIVFITKHADDTNNADAIITSLHNQVLSFVVADCFPVLLFDTKHHAFALIHCGWKSLAKNLIALTLVEMHNIYQTESKNVSVWIGPGICEKHYIQYQKPEQIDQVEWQSSIRNCEYKMYSIDLLHFIEEELLKVGIKETNINQEQLCTFEEEETLFSHRRATRHGDQDGRFFVAVWQH